MFWIHNCKIENQPHHQKTFTFRNDTTSHWIRNFFVLCDLIWKWIQKQIDMFFDIGVNSGIIAWNSGINHSDFNHKVFHLNYYLSFDVCASFRLRLSASVCLSASANFLMVAHIKKMLVYNVVTFLKRIKMVFVFLIFFWIRYVQNGSTGFHHQSKNITKNKNGHFIFDFLDPK